MPEASSSRLEIPREASESSIGHPSLFGEMEVEPPPSQSMVTRSQRRREQVEVVMPPNVHKTRVRLEGPIETPRRESTPPSSVKKGRPKGKGKAKRQPSPVPISPASSKATGSRDVRHLEDIEAQVPEIDPADLFRLNRQVELLPMVSNSSCPLCIAVNFIFLFLLGCRHVHGLPHQWILRLWIR